MFKGHPKGLLAAALSNMGERFGYYIMNAVLTLFLCSKFGLSEESSTFIYSVFYAGIYILALLGGFIADRSQNYKGTIMSGLVIMAAGYIALSIPILATEGNSTWLLALTCFALFVIAFGKHIIFPITHGTYISYRLFSGYRQSKISAAGAWKHAFNRRLILRPVIHIFYVHFRQIQIFPSHTLHSLSKLHHF